MALKVVHTVVITPGKCGLYETTREVVAGLRDLGVDSRMYDPTKEVSGSDRKALTCDKEWALGADIIVSHSGLGDDLEASKQPIVHVAHGRPRSSFLIERRGGTPIYSYAYTKNKDPRFRAVVTFWSEHIPYLKVMWKHTPIKFVPPPVDLGAWSPIGNKHDFGGRGGKVNIVCTDAWRDDADPFSVVNAIALYSLGKDVKLHIYATQKNKKGWNALIKTIEENGNMGEVRPWVKGLDSVYRAADLLATPHKIATRSIRESMACGCPVASMNGHSIPEYIEELKMNMERSNAEVRAEAARKYDLNNTAKRFKEILCHI